MPVSNKEKQTQHASLCNCKVCIQCKRLRRIAALIPADDAKFLGDVYSQLENAEMDAEYWKLKYHGCWPPPLPAMQEPRNKVPDSCSFSTM